MPALITHRLFGEESIDRLPLGVISDEEERVAFLIANQGPDPFFFHVRTTNMRSCMELGKQMHRCFPSYQFGALRDGVSYLPERDEGVGRAFVLGLLSHYVLDRTAHPFVYAQQWGIQKVDESLAHAGSQVHALIESDLDLLMLQKKRGGATVEEFPPVEELITTDRVNKVAGALLSHMASVVYNLHVGLAEYGSAVADMQMVYRLIEPAGSLGGRAAAALEGLVADYSLLGALAHRVTRETPAAGNPEHRVWENPFTGSVSHESFPEVFDRALDDYERVAKVFIESGDMKAVTGHRNYSGRVLASDEECSIED